MCAVVPTDVLDSDMFSALTESRMSAAVAAAMNYLHKRGNSVSLSLSLSLSLSPHVGSTIQVPYGLRG